ncbi:MAG: hypothetical protein KDK10_09585 [Maritimibacter sp.]|nr:hypothetical protein [Maritimibacter sp.]
MIRRVALVLLTAFAPLPALALSCEPWSPEQAFAMAEDADGLYRPAIGRFAFDPARLPGGPGGLPPAERAFVPAAFEGRALGPRGFTDAFSGNVLLQVSCALDWCGGVIPGQTYLVFFELTDRGPTAELGPCATVVFPNPDAGVERRLTGCLNGARCAPG